MWDGQIIFIKSLECKKIKRRLKCASAPHQPNKRADKQKLHQKRTSFRLESTLLSFWSLITVSKLFAPTGLKKSTPMGSVRQEIACLRQDSSTTSRTLTWKEAFLSQTSKDLRWVPRALEISLCTLLMAMTTISKLTWEKTFCNQFNAVICKKLISSCLFTRYQHLSNSMHNRVVTMN